MILVSMSPDEIYEMISKDYRKLEIRIDKYLPKAINIFKKAKSFPVWYVDNYIIPASRNEHITFYYAGNPTEITNPHYITFSATYSDNHRYLIRVLDMGYKETPDSKLVMMPQIHAYTSHFLQRYNERFLHMKNINANEVAGLFIVKNRLPFMIELNNDIKKNFLEYGDFNTHGIKVDGGFCFASTAIYHSKNNVDKEETMFVRYNTFVSNIEMSDTQKEAIDIACNETLMRCYITNQDTV